MKVVYATGTRAVTMPGGWTLLVEHGSHWAADDPVVVSHPDLFSEDPRFGIHRSYPVSDNVPNSAPQEQFRG